MKLQIVNIKLIQWDTAGQDRFRTITCSYYRGSHGILVVYDITDRESFENIKTWMQEIEKYTQDNVILILVGNKCDMNEKREVRYEEGQNLARYYKINFIETSAKNAQNIDKAFTQLAKQISSKNHPNVSQPVNQGYLLSTPRKTKLQNSTKNEFFDDTCCQ